MKILVWIIHAGCGKQRYVFLCNLKKWAAFFFISNCKWGRDEDGFDDITKYIPNQTLLKELNGRQWRIYSLFVFNNNQYFKSLTNSMNSDIVKLLWRIFYDFCVFQNLIYILIFLFFFIFLILIFFNNRTQVRWCFHRGSFRGLRKNRRLCILTGTFNIFQVIISTRFE